MITKIAPTVVRTLGVAANCLPMTGSIATLVVIVAIYSVAVVSIGTLTVVGALGVYTICIRAACRSSVQALVDICEDID